MREPMPQISGAGEWGWLLLSLVALSGRLLGGPGASTQPALVPPDATISDVYPGWSLVSLAHDPGDRTIASLTEGAAAPTGWVHRDGVYEGSTELAVGEGTWVYRQGVGVQIVLGDGGVDTDGDGVDDAAEAVAGTDPYLSLATIRPGWNALSLSSHLSGATIPDVFGRFVAATGWRWAPPTLRYEPSAELSSVDGVWVSSDYPMAIARIVYDARRYMVIEIATDRAGEPSFSVTYEASLPLLDTTPAGDLYRRNRIVLRRIPRGTYAMGSPTDEVGRGQRETQHRVSLSEDLYVGVFEVTRAQWELVTGAPPPVDLPLADDCPVHAVAWDDVRGGTWPGGDPAAASFVGVLRAGLPEVVGLDLPTEAEWEYACRARATMALNDYEANRGFGGPAEGSDLAADLPALGWFAANSGQVPRPVGGRKPNAWGLYDLHGNVAEWCLDFDDESDHGTDPVTDPAGPASSGLPFEPARIIRGGDFLEPAEACRAAARKGYLVSAARDGTPIGPGFRIVARGYDLSGQRTRAVAVAPVTETAAAPTRAASVSRRSARHRLANPRPTELAPLIALLWDWAESHGVSLAAVPWEVVEALTRDVSAAWFARFWPVSGATLR